MTPILSHCVLNFGLNPSHFVRSFHAFKFLHLSTYQCSGGKKGTCSHFLLKQSLNKKCTPLLVFTVCNRSRACEFFCRMATVLKLCNGLCVYSRPKRESAFRPRLSSFAREALLTAMED